MGHLSKERTERTRMRGGLSGLAHVGSTRHSEPPSLVRVRSKRPQDTRQRLRIARWHQPATDSILDDFRDASDRCGDDRHPSRHRLEHCHGDPVFIAIRRDLTRQREDIDPLCIDSLKRREVH